MKYFKFDLLLFNLLQLLITALSLSLSLWRTSEPLSETRLRRPALVVDSYAW